MLIARVSHQRFCNALRGRAAPLLRGSLWCPLLPSTPFVLRSRPHDQQHSNTQMVLSERSLDGIVQKVQGLASMRHPTPKDVEEVLDILPGLSTSRTSKHIARALGALKRVKTSRWVLQVLDRFATHVLPLCKARFNAIGVSTCLLSLQHRSSNDPEVRALLQALERHLKPDTAFDAQAVGNALYGLKGCSSEHAEVRSIVQALIPQISICSEPLNAQNLGNALYGLQGCKSEHAEVQAILKVLTPQIATCSEPLNAQAVGNALYGLKGCSSEHADVRSILKVLTLQIDKCSGPLDAQAFGNALFGLQTCSSEHVEVRSILNALIPRIAKCSEPLSAQQLGNALYGLQGCSSEHTEVRSIFKVLTPHFANCRELLDAQAVGNALYGLKSCSSEHAEVRSILKILARHIAICSGPLDAQAVGNALYGLQGCSSEHAEVRSILRALITQISGCSEPLCAQEVGNAVYGLKSCSSEHAEVRSILKVLTPQIAKCNEPLCAQECGNALYGLQGCSSNHSEVRSVMEILISKITRSCRLSDAQAVGNALFGVSHMRTDHVMPLLNHIVLLMSSEYGCLQFATLSESELVALSHGTAAWLLRKGVDMSLCNDKRIIFSQINRSVSDELSRRPYIPSGSQIEEDLLQCAVRVFKDDPDVTVNATGSYVFGFEADIVITVNGVVDGRGTPLTLNVEVDGPSHSRATRRRVQGVRDAHLRDNDVRVLRWDVTAPQGYSYKSFSKWLLAAVTATKGRAN